MGGTASTVQFLTDLKVDLTPDSAEVRTGGSLNNYGEFTFTGGTTSYDAYIIRRNESMRDVHGNEIEIAWRVYVPNSSLNLSVNDELTLPAPVSGIVPIVGVESRRDEHGQQVTVISCGRT